MTAQEIYRALDNLHYKIIHSPFNNKVYHSEIEALVEAKELYKARQANEKQTGTIYEQMRAKQAQRYDWQNRK